jgi:hypothetical protein
MRRRTGRLADDFSESRLSWFRSRITDDGLGRQTNQWAGRLTQENPAGMIVLVNTLYSDDDYAYVNELYCSYREFSPHNKKVKFRVLLFDLWGIVVTDSCSSPVP